MTNIIRLRNAAKIFGFERDIIAEVVTITPEQATEWLRCNRANRPVRRRHVAFLASEILNDHWQVNGQAIVIAEDEQVLDGQHRLLAIIEAGKAIKTLVVYGISPEAFRTIDTGAVRTGADALVLHFPDIAHGTLKAAATAVTWCTRLDRQTLHSTTKVSNTDVIEYVQEHPSLIQCAETLQGYPSESRPISLGCGTALYELFQRKKSELADEFMGRFYTGENLERTDVEYVLRQTMIRDTQRATKYPITTRMRMIIKGWNWRRRGREEANHQVIAITPNDEAKVHIL